MVVVVLYMPNMAQLFNWLGYFTKQLHIGLELDPLTTWSIIISPYMWIHFAKDMLFQFWPNYFSRLLHSYYLPSGHWLDGRSTNDHQTFFSISDVFLLMGYSVCKWYLCGGDVMRILLALFFFFFQHKQSYVSFYSNLSFDTNVTMVILDNIEPFNHQIDDFPYMHS